MPIFERGSGVESQDVRVHAAAARKEGDGAGATRSEEERLTSESELVLLSAIFDSS